MTSKVKLRRLFDIQTDHVSLVDKAANLRRFIFTKRKEEDMDVVESLKLVEKALNDLSSRIDTLETGNTLTFDTTELAKKGAKFSKETLASLRSLKGSLDTLLGAVDETTEEGISKEDALSALTKGIQVCIKDPEPKTKTDEELATIVAKAVSEAMKAVKE